MVFRMPGSELPGNRRVCRHIHLLHATFSHVQSLHRSHSTDDMCAWLRFELRSQNGSSIHASCFTLRFTAHWTPAQVLYVSYFSCVAVVLFSEPRPVVHAPIYPLWRSTAGWHFNGIPLLHRLWDQEDRAQQDSGQPTKSNNWRPGWSWGNWCQTVVPQPIIDAPILRFSKKHCDAARLSNYVRGWLHHCLYGNERKMKDKHELITLNEKAWWSILLGIRSVYEQKPITQEEKAWCQVLLKISSWREQRSFA